MVEVFDRFSDDLRIDEWTGLRTPDQESTVAEQIHHTGISPRKFPNLVYRIRGENFRNIQPRQFQTIFDIPPPVFLGERANSALDPDLFSVGMQFPEIQLLFQSQVPNQQNLKHPG
jgi:hypothetical protein